MQELEEGGCFIRGNTADTHTIAPTHNNWQNNGDMNLKYSSFMAMDMMMKSAKRTHNPPRTPKMMIMASDTSSTIKRNVSTKGGE